MGVRGIDELSLEGQRVFLRVDLNVPLSQSGPKKVADDTRIKAALESIEYCVQHNTRLVLASHLGRPKGKVVPDLSLEPVAARLAELLDRDIRLTDEPVGEGARKVVSDLRDGQIALLENLRFHPGEESNDSSFAEALASYADVYVNDAFGTAHRTHASTVGIVSHMEHCAVGFVMQREMKALERLRHDIARPYVAIIGGAKVSDKIEVLEALLGQVNTLLIGGAMANTFLLARGMKMGTSRVESDCLSVARSLLRKAAEKRVIVKLPVDLVVANSIESSNTSVVPANRLPADMMALDIGPQTCALFAEQLQDARTVFWNGPMGVFERAPFSAGTNALASAVAQCDGFTVVGGGDSAAAIHRAGVEAQIGHVSTGGGASLQFIQGLSLPGISALEKTG